MAAYDAFCAGYAKSQSPTLDCSTLQNLYVVRPTSPGAKSAQALYPTPGAQRWGMVNQIGGKRIFSTAASASRVFSVSGGKVYEWYFDGSAIERGSVAIDANPATIYQNGKGGDQLAITAGSNFYILTLSTNVFTQVVSLDGKATQCGFIGGYFLVFDVLSGTVYQSDLFDGLVFDPLNFFQRSVQADDWNAMLVMSWGQIFLPGTKTRDTYYNAGTFPIPFAPSQNGIQTEGSVATFGVTEIGNQVTWIGTAGQGGGYKIYAATGYAAVPISTEPIEFALSQFSQAEIAMATVEGYNDQGQDFALFYVGDTTFGFSFQTGEWHTRRTFINNHSGILGPWRPRWHCFGFNKHIWLDANSGVAYVTDISYYTDVDDLPIQRQRTSPSICRNMDMLDIGEIELKCQVGVGNTNDPGMNPQVWLEISYDGGMTWERQRAASIGREGQYFLRVTWNGNGSGRDIAFRVTCSDPVPLRIIAFFVEMFDEQGRAVSLSPRRAA